MHRLTRRQTLGVAGLAGAAWLVGWRRSDGGVATSAPGIEEVAAQSTPSCVLSPALTEGPYFVEEGLVRSDIRSDPGDGSVKDGRLLRLRLTVLKVSDSACTPYEGTTVDLWHCDAAGLYSDVAANGTVGKKFLRGSQVSDADGLVEFMTIFPGWYSGRTVHIHFKVRTYDGSSTTYEFTSQLFFDSSLTSAVYSQAPYSSRGAPGTTNSTDNIYDSSMVVPVSRSGSELVGAFSVGLSGLPGSSSGGSDDPSTPDASLTSARFARNAAGARILVLRLDVNEQVSADARLVRGGRVLARKRVQDLRAGSRRLNVRIGDRVRSGSARLKLTLRDADGNVKTIGRRLRVPGRAAQGPADRQRLTPAAPAGSSCLRRRTAAGRPSGRCCCWGRTRA